MKKRVSLFPFILIILLIPNILLLWTIDFLPFVDLPQNLSIAAIVHHYNDPDTNFQQIYALKLFPMPNIIYTLFCHYLAYLINIEAASKIFISIYILLLPLSLIHLINTLNGNRYFALMSLAFTYNYNLMWGWLSYAFAIPLFIYSLSLTLRYLFDNKNKIGITLTFLFMFLFFVHVQIYSLAILSFIIILMIKNRTNLISTAKKCYPVLPSLCIFLFWMTDNFQGGSGLPFEIIRLSATTWNRLLVNITSIRLLLMPRFSLDHLVLALFSAIILGNIVRWRKNAMNRVRDRKVSASFIILAVVIALYLFLPPHIPGQEFINQRFLLLATLLLICTAGSLIPETARTTLIPIVFLCAISVLNVAVPFYKFDKEARPARELISGLDNNKYLAGLIYSSQSKHIPYNVYLHFACYYQILKLGLPAYSCAYTWQQPVQYRLPPVLPKIEEWRPWESLFPDGWQRYDYILMCGVPFEEHMKYIIPLKLIERKGIWAVYATNRRENQ